MRARIAASVALTASIALLTAGCGFITPTATDDAYDPSDGVSATVGDVKVLNALVVTDDGETGNLVAAFANSGTKRVNVTVQVGQGETKRERTVSVAAGELENIGTEETFVFDEIGTEPGSLLPVFVQYGNETGKQLMVPVLDGSLPEYAELLP